MTKKQLEEIAGQVTISPNCQTVLFIDRHSVNQEHIQKLMNLLNARLGSGKVIIVATNGNPNFVVKPVVFNQEGKEVTE